MTGPAVVVEEKNRFRLDFAQNLDFKIFPPDHPIFGHHRSQRDGQHLGCSGHVSGQIAVHSLDTMGDADHDDLTESSSIVERENQTIWSRNTRVSDWDCGQGWWA